MTTPLRGRGARTNPPNRFETLRLDSTVFEPDEEELHRPVATRFYRDRSRTVLERNDSPDIPFRYSLNPYRGCEHGCVYCYARPSHEYLGFSAGLDFESKIMVKTDAPELLERTFRSARWKPEPVALSGNTDCYQPAERALMLTRRCLEVFRRFRNPVSITTKNALILRDLDHLTSLAEADCVHVAISITSLDHSLVRVMEPRTSAPARRLETIAELARRNIPVGVTMAPVIPGLTDEEIPQVLAQAAQAGARYSGYTLLRLPGAVAELFVDWLRTRYPSRADRVINRIRDTRGGELDDCRFGIRMEGEGEIARAIDQLFTLNARKYSLDAPWSELSTTRFRRDTGSQLELL